MSGSAQAIQVGQGKTGRLLASCLLALSRSDPPSQEESPPQTFSAKNLLNKAVTKNKSQGQAFQTFHQGRESQGRLQCYHNRLQAWGRVR